MKRALIFLSLISSTTVLANSMNQFVGIYDDNFNVTYHPIGYSESDAQVSFLDITSESVEVEAFSEDNFEGQTYVFDYENMPTAFSDIKSFRIVASSLGSYGDTSKIYFKMDSRMVRCMDVSYFIPSMNVGKTAIGTFCTSSEPQEIFDFSAMPDEIKSSDIRFVVDSPENSFVTGFKASLVGKNTALIGNEKLFIPSGYKIKATGANVLSMTRYF